MLKLIFHPRFVKRELKMEDVVSLDVLTEVDVLGDGDQEEDEEDEDVNDGEDDESEEEEDMNEEEEEIGGDEDIEMDKEANAWVGTENELLHIKFNSNEEPEEDNEEEDDEEKEVKDVTLKVEEEERMENLRIEDGEVACKGEVGKNLFCLIKIITFYEDFV